jgi:nitric oxide reductase NorD protein
MTHHYNLIASALAGRNVTVHHHSNKILGPYTDGIAIYLPVEIAESEKAEIMAVIAQAILLRGESLRMPWLQRLVGKRHLARRYIYAEVCRGAKHHKLILPRMFCRAPEILAFGHINESPDDSFALASSQTIFPDIPYFIGSPRPLLLLKTAFQTPAASAPLDRKQDVSGASNRIPELSDAEKDDAKDSKILKFFENPLVGDSLISDLLRNLLGGARTGKPDKNPSGGGGAEMPMSGITESVNKGIFSTLAEVAIELISTEDDDDAGSQRYPEWDFVRGKYRDNWACVDEIDPWPGEAKSTDELKSLLAPPSLLLKRNLAGIGLSYEVHQNQKAGDDFSLNRLVDYAIALHAGIPHSENLFDETRKTRRDLAVIILQDISASTGEKDAHGMSIHRKQIRLSYQLMSAFHELGDHVSLYGFHSWGRQLVRFQRIKSFKEMHVGSGVQARMAQLQPLGYTRMGAALRHANKKLMNETRLPYRLMVVVTDGFSYDQDYEGRYGEEDTRKALAEIRSTGTGILCLTVGNRQDNRKVADVFGPAVTLSANEEEELIQHLRPAVLRAMSQIRG